MLNHYAIFLEGVLLALVKKCHSYTNLFIEITVSPWNSENTVSAIFPGVSAGEESEHLWFRVLWWIAFCYEARQGWSTFQGNAIWSQLLFWTRYELTKILNFNWQPVVSLATEAMYIKLVPYELCGRTDCHHSALSSAAGGCLGWTPGMGNGYPFSVLFIVVLKIKQSWEKEIASSW